MTLIFFKPCMLPRFACQLRATVCSITLMVTGGLAIASEAVLSPFESHYDVNYSGFAAGREISLARDGPDYILRSTTTLRGFARLSGMGPVYEVSRFEFRDGVIRPRLYTVGDGEDNPKRDIRIEFDWDLGVSHGFAKGKDQSFPLEPGMQDPLTFELMARLELTRGASNLQFRVHEGHRVRGYTFNKQGVETLEVRGQPVQVTRYFIDRNSSRELYYWFDPDTLYLVMQLRQRHKGRTKGTVTLTHSTLLD
jgi:hypothetical protein